MLASLQRGHTVEDSDPLVVQFRIQLTGIEGLCADSERRIADEAVATHNAMEKRGVDESILSVLSHARRSIPVSAVPAKCAEVFAAYAAQRTGG